MSKRSAVAGWLLGLGPLVLAAGQALAASEVGQSTADIVHEAEHESGGMPQLDASTFATQILWLIISFVVLYYLLKRKALPRVADILEARQERISADLDRAAALRVDAEAAFEQYEAVVAEAQAKAQAEIKATREAIAADVAGRTATLDRDLAARIAAAERTVAAARDKALGELEGVAVEVAQAATERLIGVQVGDEEARAALARARQEVA
ncbi:MAG: hypothetical protein R3D28_16605 [Geminicoccaceae bacterium]|nr:hypothetical protein [Geminicoccaceae bacterium]HRY23858.1 hypothetical protein [Geminicoccaceae bacterium]